MATRIIRLNDIVEEVQKHHPEVNTALIEKAYVFSARVHEGQTRLSGGPYLSHPLEVAYLLSQMGLGPVTVACGLLHDTVEDTDTTLDDLDEYFGEEVADVVNGITKIGQLVFGDRITQQAEYIRKMILSMSHDIRVLLVKLADRVHNMRTLGFQPHDKQEMIAKETLDLYAPLAGRMGIFWLKSTLEDLCLYYLEPEIYEKIKSDLAERKGVREQFIQEVIALLNGKLKEAGIKATVKGRHKHLYSIYMKMKEQNLTPSQVYDVVAFRVIVDSLRECYEVLGIIHATWKPVPGRFKDYVSLPKANMYQSLHTTVIGPVGQRMEIQIRTWEMDRVAEEGIAAHWKYKEGQSASKTDAKQFAWLRQLLEWQMSLKDPKEFMESVRMDLFPNEVYVFTPKGEVKEFPKGATPVDFAYSIHSEVGDKCIGAKVNGRMVPLRYRLKNGDAVEIVTSAKHHPSKDWLDFVVTPRARTKIKQWIMRQEREQSINLGREILEKSLDQSRVNLPSLMKGGELPAVAKELSFHSVDDLLANLGFGRVSAKQVIGRLKAKLGIAEEEPAGLVSKVVARIKRKKSTSGIKVKGLEDILVRFANCCHPLPGEHVAGFLTRGRGVTIHTFNCRHVMDAPPERVVEVAWEPSDHDVYTARLKVVTNDKKGILADISTVMAQKDANIIQAEIQTTMDKKGVSHFTIEVENFKQLHEIMGAIKKIKSVLLVERL
jgi:GTP pyrophosphokinase